MLTSLSATAPRAGRTEEWVPRDASTQSGRGSTGARPDRNAKPAGGTAKAPSPTKAAAGTPAAAPALDRIETRLGRMEARLDALEAAAKNRLEDAEARLKALESGSSNRGASRPQSKRTRKTTTPAKRTTARTSKAQPKRNSGAKTGKGRRKRDLNTISFEQLRELGLAVTQSARLVAARESRGGFSSLDQLDDLRGISAKTREKLKEAATV